MGKFLNGPRPRRPASSSKAVTPAQVTKEKKSIVKEIKKRITRVKFHQGRDRVAREVKFAADRITGLWTSNLIPSWVPSRADWRSTTKLWTKLGSMVLRSRPQTMPRGLGFCLWFWTASIFQQSLYVSAWVFELPEILASLAQHPEFERLMQH